jgi:hypothetical protein
MGWGNLDPDNDSFTTSSIVIPYKGGISYQFLQNLAKNTSYNYRHCDQHLLILNESFGVDEEKDFDTDFDYQNAHVQIVARGTNAAQSLPFEVDISATPMRYAMLTTTYQSLVSGSYFDIRAQAAGGIRIKNERYGGTRYLSCSIMELRQVTGS